MCTHNATHNAHNYYTIMYNYMCCPMCCPINTVICIHMCNKYKMVFLTPLETLPQWVFNQWCFICYHATGYFQRFQIISLLQKLNSSKLNHLASTFYLSVTQKIFALNITHYTYTVPVTYPNPRVTSIDAVLHYSSTGMK